MSKYAICDNCGEKDDYSMERGKPILYQGAVIQIREDDGDKFQCELEICNTCVEKLLKEWPKLDEAIKS